MNINTAIDCLPHTSATTIKRLKLLGVNTCSHLLNYFPYRYENYSLISTIDKLQPEETVTIKGKIAKVNQIYTKKGLTIQKVLISDSTSSLELIWYNQPYLLRIFKKAGLLSISGKVEKDRHRLTIKPEEYELISSFDQPTIHTVRLAPIYSEQKGLSSKTLREKIFFLLNNLTVDQIQSCSGEPFPREIISYNDLIDEETAYRQIHFPQSLALAGQARRRLAFDELFILQLASKLIKKTWQNQTVANRFILNDNISVSIKRLIDTLPFTLTSGQKHCWQQILSDLKGKIPMNRLLQGEVGSGKTVVAALAAYLSYLNGYQTLFMAPTEILVHQHYQTISNLFKGYPVKIGLQTGAKKIAKEKSTVENYHIIIGTQALIQKKIRFNKVGLVIVDEQHRFGVHQRAQLKEKGICPHLLSMTATPIPRTVALTLYGELDLSFLDELPVGRLTVKTFLVPRQKRSSAYNWIIDQIKKNKTQVFIICPLIEESEVETIKSVKAATVEYHFLKNNVFTNQKIGLLHGRLKAHEKKQIMADFKDKKYDILVATSVVEVGIDVSNATVMVIEGAERYGLAQLHQLIGRVGRGGKQSYCLLFTDSESNPIRDRLTLFVKTVSGNQLAEYDLKIRGPCEIYGQKQHGYLNLKIASLTDYHFISQAKKAVDYFISQKNLSDYPEINQRLTQYQTALISHD